MPYKDPEKNAQAKRESRARHRDDPEVKERERLRARAYYAANRELLLAKQATYYREHKEDVLAKHKKRMDDLRQQMLDAYGRECQCCGETIERFLTLDHVNKDGKQDRETCGNNIGVLRRLRKEGWPNEGYRVLCANCNMATAWGICPHQMKED